MPPVRRPPRPETALALDPPPPHFRMSRSDFLPFFLQPCRTALPCGPAALLRSAALLPFRAALRPAACALCPFAGESVFRDTLPLFNHCALSRSPYKRARTLRAASLC